MESLLQDLRFSVRVFRRTPGVTLVIVLTLALGIGANTAMFSVVDSTLLRPLSYHEPGNLCLIFERDPAGATTNAAPATYLDWVREANTFEGLAAWIPQGLVLTGLERPEQLQAGAVSANFFEVLGVKAALGRTFLPDEDGLERPERASRVAVLSHRMWLESLGGDQNVLGRTIRLNGQPYAIVGVMGPEFQFISRRHSLWIPIVMDRTNREFHNLTVLGRVRQSLTQSSAQMDALMRRIADAYPKTNKGRGAQIQLLAEWLVQGNFRKTLLLLFGAVGIVLMVSCVNVANLLLARSAGRSREISLRASIGATRIRVVRQLLTESVTLAAAGGIVGLGLAWVLVNAAPKILPAFAVPPTSPIRISELVLVFTAGIAMLTGVLFGLAPALTASKVDLAGSLKEGTRGGTPGRASGMFRNGLVVAEVALAMVLLAGAGLMVESLRRLTTIDIGCDPKNLLTFSVFLPPTKYREPHRALAFHRDAADRIASLPGVRAVSAGTHLPLQRMTMRVPFDLEIGADHPIAERPAVFYVTISHTYLATLGIPLRRGRGFRESDNENAAPVILVNEAFVRRYFPSADPVGQRIILNRPQAGRAGFEPDIKPEIVGVVADVKLSNLSAAPDPTVYVPLAQNAWSPTAYIGVRAERDAASLISAVRREILAIDREQPIDRVTTMEQTFSEYFAEPRFRAQLFGAFAVLALVLAVVGIYGVNSHAVAQRRHEIGVRMALGAAPGDVAREALMRGLRVTGLGIAIGAALSIGLARVVASVITEVKSSDPIMLAGVGVILAAVALIACWVPARRAARVDPSRALRQE